MAIDSEEVWNEGTKRSSTRDRISHILKRNPDNYYTSSEIFDEIDIPFSTPGSNKMLTHLDDEEMTGVYEYAGIAFVSTILDQLVEEDEVERRAIPDGIVAEYRDEQRGGAGFDRAYDKMKGNTTFYRFSGE